MLLECPAIEIPIIPRTLIKCVDLTELELRRPTTMLVYAKMILSGPWQVHAWNLIYVLSCLTVKYKEHMPPCDFILFFFLILS